MKDVMDSERCEQYRARSAQAKRVKDVMDSERCEQYRARSAQAKRVKGQAADH